MAIKHNQKLLKNHFRKDWRTQLALILSSQVYDC